MGSDSDVVKMRQLMDAMGRQVKNAVSVLFCGGATAVLLGFRESTVDVNLTFEPEHEEMFKLIKAFRDDLNINIELTSPAHFIPELEGSEARHVFIEDNGAVSFYHYDLYMQVLSNIERAWPVDLSDARSLAKYVDLNLLTDLFLSASSAFERFPAIDRDALETKLRNFISDVKG